MLVKQKRKTDQDIDTKIEYETMVNLWKLGYASETSLRIPQPFHYDVKNNFIVMEFIYGRKLSRILAFDLRYPMCFFQTNQNIEYIRRTALWLTEYEKKVETTQLTNLADTVKGYLDYKVDDIHFLNSDEKDGLKTSIQEYAKSLDFIPSLLTNLDFKPHNIIMNKISTVGIDWEKMKDKCVVFWMPATFLRYLDNAKTKFSISNSAVSKIKKEFLRTYWNNTPFHKSKNIFPLICSLELIAIQKRCS